METKNFSDDERPIAFAMIDFISLGMENTTKLDRRAKVSVLVQSLVNVAFPNISEEKFTNKCDILIRLMNDE
jgi:hypothetical protein